jgi:hypothetical protein
MVEERVQTGCRTTRSCSETSELVGDPIDAPGDGTGRALSDVQILVTRVRGAIQPEDT